MIDGPGASKPNLKIPAATVDATQSPVQGNTATQNPPNITQSPVAPPSDTFSTELKTKGMPSSESSDSNPLVQRSQDGKPTGPRQVAAKDPVLNNCEIAVQEGETWFSN